MSAILNELIKLRRDGVADYEALLKKYIDLVKKIETPENNPNYPESIRHSGALRAFYDNCGEDETLAITLDKIVRENKLDGFRHNMIKERIIKRELFTILKDHDKVDRVFNIVVEQEEY